MKHLRLSTLFLAFATGIFLPVSGQTPLSGSIAGTYPAAVYVVSGDAAVPHSKTASFEAGSILRFENFSGITVHGSFICKGTPGRPVIFTSVNDNPGSGTMPEPFDWNGIKAGPDALNVALEHCVVTYSTFGITIESSATPVVLTNVSFHHNGSSSLMIEKKMMPVTENMPVSFTGPKAPEVPRPGITGTKKTGEASIGGHGTFSGPAWKKPARISCAASAMGGAALWLAGFLCAEHYNGLITPGTSMAMADDYKKSWNSWVAVRNTGAALFGLGAAGFAVTFVF